MAGRTPVGSCALITGAGQALADDDLRCAGSATKYSKGSSDRNRSLGASQLISNGLLMLIRGNHIVFSVLLSEIELESSAGFL